MFLSLAACCSLKYVFMLICVHFLHIYRTLGLREASFASPPLPATSPAAQQNGAVEVFDSQELELVYKKVLGTENPGDLMTKYLGQEVIDKLMPALSQQFTNG